MDVRDVYLLLTLLGFMEISKETYEDKLRKGYEHNTVSNELCEDHSVTWAIRICYPKIFSEDEVFNRFNRNYTMYTGILV